MTRLQTKNTLILDGGETKVVFTEWEEVDSILRLFICDSERKELTTYMDKAEWGAFKRAGDIVFKEQENEL